MKYARLLTLMAMACAALMAFVSTASATTLDTHAGNVKSGTLIHAEATEAVLEDTFSVIENICESTAEGKTTNETGATVNGILTNLIWENCEFPTNTIRPGTLSIKWTSGRNGTVSGSGTEVETELFTGGICIYGTGAGTTLGTFDGVANTTEAAKVTINTVVKLLKTVSGICLSSARWTAIYVIDNPLGLTAKS